MSKQGYSKIKGRNAENEAIAILQKRWATAARTSYTVDQRTKFGRDVIGVPDSVFIQIKRRKTSTVGTLFRNTAEAAGPDRFTALIHRDDRSPWLITLTLEDWMTNRKC